MNDSQIEIVNYFIGTLVVLTQVLTVVSLAAFLVYVKTKKSHPIVKIIKQYGYKLAAFISVFAVSGSLFYSEIADYAPCVLCWWQRIFMYPMAVILPIGLLLKDKKAKFYSLALSVIGVSIAIYHYFMQRGVVEESGTCSVVGYSNSCGSNYFEIFGYITIPMMALTAFAAILTISAVLIVTELKQRTTKK